MKKSVKVLLGILIFLVILISVIILFMFFYPGVGKVPDVSSLQASNLNEKGSFQNEGTLPPNKGKSMPWSDRNKPKGEIPVVKVNDTSRSRDLKFNWLGHSSILLRYEEKNILIDPVLGNYVSPVSFAGLKRFCDIPMTADQVPDIDILFISHDHYDHLDYHTLRRIDPKVGQYIVPLGVDSVLISMGIPADKIKALSWWESVEKDSLTFTLTPGRHFSGRNPLRRSNPTLWGGIYIKGPDLGIYYTGDSGYCNAFSQVYEKLGAPDLMFVENGQYNYAWSNVHMFPEETARAVADAHAKRAVPVHWGAYVLAPHAWDDPIKGVTAASEDLGIKLITPRIGEEVDYSAIDNFTGHWWEAID